MAQPVPAEHKGVTLTAVQIGQWAASAGFPKEELGNAIAIALAESSGRIDAVGGPNANGTYDYGVWQINEGAHPQLFQQYPQWWSAANGKMAFDVWTRAGNKWTPWSVWNSGAYRFYSPEALAAASKIDPIEISPESDPDPISAIPEALNEIGNAFKSIAGGVGKAGQWMGEGGNWVRVAQVVAGGAMLLSALTIVMKPLISQIPLGNLISKAGK